MDTAAQAAAQWAVDHPANAIGCVIFWLYILFALIFTGFIFDSLYLRLAKPTIPSRRQADTIFTTLAMTSFASLSFNMLHFLIRSYQHWTLTRGDILSPEGIFSFFGNVSAWSFTSTLFHDFAQDIVQSNACFVWTLAALWITFAVSLQLGLRGIPSKIPRPWAFVGLGQILPISFTQNLLYVARLRGPQSPVIAPNAATFERAVFGIAVIYAALPFALPADANNAWLMATIALLRLSLLAPPIASMLQGKRLSPPHQSSNDRSYLETMITALGLAACSTQLYIALNEVSPMDIARSLFASPAVSALGIDCMIGIISAICWSAYGEQSIL